MKDKIINITAESLPWQAKLIGALFLFGAIAIISTAWWLSLIFALIGLTVLTAYSGTEINFANNTYREYNSTLFIRKGASKKFCSIEKVFINKAKVSQRMYTAHTSKSSTFHHIIFNAYLKFDDGTKIFLTSRKNKDQLMKIMEPITTILAMDLADDTVLNRMSKTH